LSEAQKNAILDGITANIAFVDKDLKIIWVNKTAAESVKKSPAEMTGLTCHHFWADPARPCENCPSIKALDTNKSAQTIMHTPDGRVWEERGEPVFDTGGNLIGVVEIASDITGRGRLESQKEAALDALRESEEKYRLLIENSHDIIYTLSSEGVFTFVSPSWTTLLGHTVNQVVGKLFQQFVHPDDFAVCIATIRKVMESGQRQESIEYRVRHADGSWRWHVTNAVPIRDAAGRVVSGEGIARDITERKQAESQKEAALAALRENGSRLDLAMQAANMAWWEMDISTGNVTFAKRKAEMLGFPPEKFKHYKDFTALVHPEDHDRTMAAMRGHIDGIFDKYEVEYRILTKAGEYKWFYDIGSVVKKDAKEKPLNVAGLVINITERKKADEEIKRQLAEKEILLKEVHHRIKNNIAAIGGLISLRLESITNPEAIAVLQDTIGRVDSMRILYDKLLLSEDYKDIAVKNYVESIAETVIALFPVSTKIKLDKRIADFQLDPKRLFPLGIIINELITNKMKYAFINRKTGVIKISLAKVAGRIKLTVEDNGIGLPAGFDSDQTKGFGLMLVKMLSQQLGGSFAMEKKAGTRCTVEFDI
jgi:PAS domain S-box-containing protein